MNSKQLSVPTIISAIIAFSGVLCLCGCEGFRYAATEAQKQNAWLHREVCAAAAETAVEENTSTTLCDLTTLAHEQSAAFVADYGLPEFISSPPVKSLKLLPCEGEVAVRPEGFNVTRGYWESDYFDDGKRILSQANADSLRKPDAWTLADSAMDLGLALAGLVGGAYGIRIARYLKTAREKSKALKEIVAGNELFKQLWPEQADRFKEAQQKQSPATKQLVTQLKAG
jgi:hypothetical protein